MSRSFISARGLAAFRAAGASARPSRAQRFRRVVTEPVSGGEWSVDYPADAIYEARLEPVVVSEGPAEDTVLAEGEWVLALPVEGIALPGDRFVVTDTGLDGEPWSRVIYVVGTPGPHTWETERVVRCSSREPDVVA